MNLREYIRDVEGFKEGITFFDITPLLASPKAFANAIDTMAERFASCGATKILAAEARGFIFGAPLAYKMGMGFIPVRKPGKLPYQTCQVTYDLEYGTDTLCMHIDAVAPGESVLVIDDLMATGGTMGGVLKLVEAAGGSVAGVGVLIELGFLDGRGKIGDVPYEYVIQL